MRKLWNCSLEIISAKFDGKTYRFAPDEKKVINDDVRRFIRNDAVEEITHSSTAITNHLLHKLQTKGLCEIDDTMSEEQLLEVRIEALMRYRDHCVAKLINYETLNKEREKASMGRQLPDKTVKEAAHNKKKVDAILEELNASDTALIDEVMSGLTESDRVSQEIKEDLKEATDIGLASPEKTEEQTKKRGRPRKV